MPMSPADKERLAKALRQCEDELRKAYMKASVLVQGELKDPPDSMSDLDFAKIVREFPIIKRRSEHWTIVFTWIARLIGN